MVRPGYFPEIPDSSDEEYEQELEKLEEIDHELSGRLAPDEWHYDNDPVDIARMRESPPRIRDLSEYLAPYNIGTGLPANPNLPPPPIIIGGML